MSRENVDEIELVRVNKRLERVFFVILLDFQMPLYTQKKKQKRTTD